MPAGNSKYQAGASAVLADLFSAASLLCKPTIWNDADISCPTFISLRTSDLEYTSHGMPGPPGCAGMAVTAAAADSCPLAAPIRRRPPAGFLEVSPAGCLEASPAAAIARSHHRAPRLLLLLRLPPCLPLLTPPTSLQPTASSVRAQLTAAAAHLQLLPSSCLRQPWPWGPPPAY